MLPVLLLAPALLATACEPAPPPPANDGFATPQVLPSTAAGLVGISTRGATIQAGEPEADGGSTWYRWTAPQTGVAVFELGGGFDEHAIDVFTGSALSSLSPLGQPHGSGWGSTGARVVAGSTYRIRVSGSAFTAALRWRSVSAPVADALASAGTLSGEAGSVRSDTTAATASQDDPRIAGQRASATVWYRWTAPVDGYYELDTAGSAYDTVLGVFPDTDGVAALADNDDGCADTTPVSAAGVSRLGFTAVAGMTYRVAVGASTADEDAGDLGGRMQLNWRSAPTPQAPANDALSGAQPISGTFGTVDGTTLAATAQAGEPAHTGQPARSSVWFAWTPPKTASYLLGAGSGTCGTRIAVYRTAPDVTGLVPVPAQAASQYGPVDGVTSVRLTGGTSYRIAVDSLDRSGGDFEFDWDVPQAAPQITRIAAGDRAVTVTWAPPAPAPGTPRTGYFVVVESDRPDLDPEPQYVPVTTGSVTVRGLRNGVAYRALVAAVNGAGPGAFAVSSRVVPVAPRR